MQIMPQTWAGLHSCYGLGGDSFAAKGSTFAGTEYLGEQHDRYGAADFLAAYNAGPARWEGHLRTGRLLPVQASACILRLVPIIDRLVDDDTTVLVAVVNSWTEAPLHPVLSPHPANDKTITFNASPAHHSNEPVAHDKIAPAPHSPGLFGALSSLDQLQ